MKIEDKNHKKEKNLKTNPNTESRIQTEKKKKQKNRKMTKIWRSRIPRIPKDKDIKRRDKVNRIEVENIKIEIIEDKIGMMLRKKIESL